MLVFPVFFVFSSPATITVYHIARGLSSIFFKKIEKTHLLLNLHVINILNCTIMTTFLLISAVFSVSLEQAQDFQAQTAVLRLL